MSGGNRFGGTRLRALLGAHAAVLALLAIPLAAGARAETIEPHLAKPDLVTPHEVAPALPGDSSRQPGPPANDPATGAAPPGSDEAPPTYIECTKDKLFCGLLTPEEVKLLEESKAARQAQKRREEEEELQKMAELREKYLADHPPTVIHLYIGQFLCPLFSRGWTILVRDENYTDLGGLLPSPELKAAKELFDQLRWSYSCITAVAP
jgi:hypothetical protein